MKITLRGTLATTLDIEQTDLFLAYLRDAGRLAPGEVPVFRTLAGGVSNRTVLVKRASGPAWVVKQALPRLRVATNWESDPSRIHREALALQWLPSIFSTGVVPRFVFADSQHHVLAMEAVPMPHENWKLCLLRGEVESQLVAEFGRILAQLHLASPAPEWPADFSDRSFFESLRIDPYYRYSARQQPAAARFIESLIEETLACRLTLVHGDYSPKNTLVYQDHLVLLDYEVIHVGDPAFDVGFALTHFLAKALHRPTERGRFLEAASLFWETYQQVCPTMAEDPTRPGRAVRHTLGCLLARVDGRSPLEYLTDTERAWQRRWVLDLMVALPKDVPDLVLRWGAGLSHP